MSNKKMILAYIVGGFALLYALKNFFKTDEQKRDEKETKTLKAEIKKGGKNSLPLSNFAALADKIYNAGMNSIGTDESAIYNTFAILQTKADLLALIEAFGKRRAEFSTIDVGLGGFLSSELDTNEMAIINSMLSKKGINYKF